MGDMLLNCPLCCTKTFDSKESLLEHLNSIGDLHCPVCSGKFPSLPRLKDHLTVDNCLPVSEVPNLLFENSSGNGHNDFQSENTDHIDGFKTLDSVGTLQDGEDNFLPVQTLDSDVNKMYVELIKPCLDSQELKLVKDSSDRYVIITDSDADLNSGTIVTKQNNDGTISLTTVNDMKLDPDSLMASEQESESQDTEEPYSCNACGVSFTSVIEHIQNYHNDQDVVVEGHIDDGESESMPIQFQSIKAEDTVEVDKQPSRRVITDTGDIVETPYLRVTSDSLPQKNTVPAPSTKAPTTDNKKRRFVQVDKLCDSVIKDLQPNRDLEDGTTIYVSEKNVPYHKVVMKEVETPEGGKEKVYKCMWCNVSVNALAEFSQHPCKTLKYCCTQCTASYDNAKSLCAHMKVHKLKSPGQNAVALQETYECEVCCTEFHSNKSLKLHKRMHDPPKSRPAETIKIEDEKKYKCNLCFKMIPLEYEDIHQNFHKTDETLNCDVCNKKFTSMEYLDMHMNVHSTDKAPQITKDKTLPYCCSYCDRRFARPHEKVKHERIHTGEKPHACDICGKSFRVSYCLTLHMRTHTGHRPYECPHCGKKFKAHSVYNHHLLTHSEVRAYKCPFCPKAFKTSVQLAGHKNSHTKPFSCTHCNRPFSSLYAVRVHTETHSRQNNLKFSCSLCGASYARAFALKDHVRQVHDKELDQLQPIESLTEDSDDWKILNSEIHMDMTPAELIVPN